MTSFGTVMRGLRVGIGIVAVATMAYKKYRIYSGSNKQKAADRGGCPKRNLDCPPEPCNQNALEKKPPFAYSPPKNRAKRDSSRIQGLAFESTVQQKYKTNTGETVEIIYTFPVACSPIYAFEDCDGVFIDECDFQIPTFSRKLTDLDLSPRQAAAAWVQAVCRATSIAQCVEMISPKKTMANVSCSVAEVARSGNLSEHQVWGIFFDWLLETLYKECHFDRHAKRVLDKAMLDITQESILTVKQQLAEKYPYITENSWKAA